VASKSRTAKWRADELRRIRAECGVKVRKAEIRTEAPRRRDGLEPIQVGSLKRESLSRAPPIAYRSAVLSDRDLLVLLKISRVAVSVFGRGRLNPSMFSGGITRLVTFSIAVSGSPWSGQTNK